MSRNKNYGFFDEGGAFPVPNRGDLLEDAHSWIGPDGLQDYTRLMRGEKDLPHIPDGRCRPCREIFMEQLEIIGVIDFDLWQAAWMANMAGVNRKLQELTAVVNRDN